MSRYTGPRLRKVRRLGVALPGLVQKDTVRMYPPGIHGQGRRPRKASDYALRLKETQKLRFHYGLRERQLRHVIRRALNSKQASDAKLLALLESRLDNVLFRAGLAPTNRAARQVVSHNHVLVNGKRANIPSMVLSAGDVVTIKERSTWGEAAQRRGCLPSPFDAHPGLLGCQRRPKQDHLRARATDRRGLPRRRPHRSRGTLLGPRLSAHNFSIVIYKTRPCGGFCCA